MAFTLRPIQGKGFVNRKEEIKDIIKTLKNKDIEMGFALYGKRRVGKTSIFKEVERILKKDKTIVPVYFSMMGLADTAVENFVRLFTITILEAYKPILGFDYQIRELVKTPLKLMRTLLKKLNLGFKIEGDIEVLLRFEKIEQSDYDTLIEDLFNLPERLAKRTKTRCVLLIDEFPLIMSLKNGSKIGEAIIGKIRTLYENQKYTTLCISGSIRKTMDIVAFSSTSAFYKQLIAKEVKPLSKEHIKQILVMNLKKRMFSDDAVDLLYGFTKGIPFYIHFIGRIIGRLDIRKIEKNVIIKAIEEFLNEEGNIMFKEELSRLSSKEIKIIKSMVVNNVFSPSGIAKSIGDPLNVTGTFLSYLEEKEIVEKKERGVYKIEDPIFEKWLKKRFESQNFNS